MWPKQQRSGWMKSRRVSDSRPVQLRYMQFQVPGFVQLGTRKVYGLPGFCLLLTPIIVRCIVALTIRLDIRIWMDLESTA
jgi:hypothetical protein